MIISASSRVKCSVMAMYFKDIVRLDYQTVWEMLLFKSVHSYNHHIKFSSGWMNWLALLSS